VNDDTQGFNACEHLPDDLKSKKLFTVWRFTPNPVPGKKPRKVPFYTNGKPREGTQGDAKDLEQLATYAEAVAAGRRGQYTGIGMATVPGCGIVALDFDNVVAAGVIHPGVLALCEGTYTEFSPSGTGIRAFFSGTLKSRKDTTGEKGAYPLEVFGDSGFVTITGNVIEDCSLFGFDSVVAPISDAVLAEYEKRWGSAGGGTGMVAQSENDRWLLSIGTRKGWSIADARVVLADCDPSCDRDHWLKVGMALHHEFDGSDEAFDLYNEWSAKGSSYVDEKDVRGRWRSFGRGHGANQITGVWLEAWRKECQKRAVYTQVEDWKHKIKTAGNEYDLREKVCVKIKEDQTLGDIEREVLAQALLEAFRAIGVKLPIAQCRKMLVKKLVQKRDPNFSIADESHYPDWLKGFVYVTSTNEFYMQGSAEGMNKEAFNDTFNRYMPRDDNGMVTISASVMALEQYQIMTVTRQMYVPWAGPIFREEGSGTVEPGPDEARGRSWMVNTYRPSAVPVAVEKLSPGGENAVRLVLRHLSIYCGGRQREAEIALSYLAHNVQHPGKKVRSALLLQGVEGDGKSLFEKLMGAMMGAHNVKTISATVLLHDFTAWAMGHAFAIMEEVRVVGHSRHDVHNRMKPAITNDRIEVHKKGKDAFDCINTQNYMIVTNHKDAIPIDNNDRRFFVIFSPFATGDELKKYLEQFGGYDKYFADLHTAIEDYGPELRRFMLDYKLHPEFNANGRAPYTREKAAMVEAGKTDEQMLFEHIIERGAIGVSQQVFLSKYLHDAARAEDPDLQIDKHSLNRVFTKLGFTRLDGRVKWQGGTHICWVKGLDSDFDGEPKRLLSLTVTNAKFASVDLFDKRGEDGSNNETDLFGGL